MTGQLSLTIPQLLIECTPALRTASIIEKTAMVSFLHTHNTRAHTRIHAHTHQPGFWESTGSHLHSREYLHTPPPPHLSF